MNFIFGRNNLALTIFVPFDCKNSCPFCTSKKTYTENKPSVNAVKDAVNNFFACYNFPIKDVVFTGGEPMANLEVLAELIDLIPSGYNVYINTTFTKTNSTEFITLVNENPKIKGVNISRHSETFLKDQTMFYDLAEDEYVDKFIKPVRINCVISDQDIERVIARWSKHNVELCFREDFTTMQDDEKHLHDPFGVIPMRLLSMGYHFYSHTQCNVCDTTKFIKDSKVVSFHKGRRYSSITRGNELEINDLIIDQAGNFSYDWGNDSSIICELLKLEYMTTRITQPQVLTISTSGCGGFCRSYCGSSGCGGSGGCG